MTIEGTADGNTVVRALRSRGNLVERLPDRLRLVGFVLLLAQVVGCVAVLVTHGRDGDRPRPSAAQPVEPWTGPPPAAATVPLPRYPGKGSPTNGRISDFPAQVTYISLGGVWKAASATPETDGLTTKYTFRDRNGVTATIGSGPIQDYPGVTGRGWDWLRSLALRAYDHHQTGIPWATVEEDRSRPVWLDGHAGWLVTRNVGLSTPGRSGISGVVVLDTGHVLPAVLWFFVPDTRKDLYRDISTVIASLNVQ
ncbi:hypothetical protein DZF91_33195 [Actinomadura logoneensis]|uniref:Uncharacterized protein n=1 Tax=Actinomadura logoneensis TaxID=2293572 RepID=A0A372JBJ4_9ACTN|nr:hypothetical protein [Actinomadura logoneensis]RFU37377.1 hypothetical protein DZF91_33195 [Actinomadura logoneensis]